MRDEDPGPGPVSPEYLRIPSNGTRVSQWLFFFFLAGVGWVEGGGGGGADNQLWDLYDPYPDDSLSLFILKTATGHPHGYVATNIYTDRVRPETTVC